MITIYECTDCDQCAIFNGGDRLICMSPALSPNEVCKYSPITEGRDAENCKGFHSSWTNANMKNYSGEQWKEAEKWSEDNFHDVTYEGIKDWIEKWEKDRYE